MCFTMLGVESDTELVSKEITCTKESVLTGQSRLAGAGATAAAFMRVVHHNTATPFTLTVFTVHLTTCHICFCDSMCLILSILFFFPQIQEKILL